MDTRHFLPELKLRTAASDWPWLLLSLRQDHLVWKGLMQDELAGAALQAFGEQPEAWMPARLALLALQLEHPELDSLPFEQLRQRPLPEPLSRLAQAAYQGWVEEPEIPLSLAQAGLVALWLLELSEQEGGWETVFRMADLIARTAPAVAACLLGLTEEPDGLLVGLARSNPQLAVHALLSNPMPPSALSSWIQRLLVQLPLAQQTSLIKELRRFRPGLAVQQAGQVLEAQARALRPEASPLAHLVAGQHLAELHQLAAQPAQAARVWLKTLQTAQRLQAQLMEKLVQAAAAAQESDPQIAADVLAAAGLANGEGLLAKTPTDPSLAVTWLRSLPAVGRSAQAGELLAKLGPDHPARHHPAVLVQLALCSLEQGESGKEAARQAALQALEQLESPAREAGAECDLREGDFVALGQLLWDLGLVDEAGRTARLGLQQYPVSRALLRLETQVQQLHGAPEDVLAEAYTLLALDELGDHSGGQDGKAQEGDFPGRVEARRLIISSLEKGGCWPAALQERTQLVTEQVEPSRQDLRELVTCAIQAGCPQQALQAARKLVEAGSAESTDHVLLARAAAQAGDLDLAQRHYEQAVNLAPEEAGNWVALADIYEKRGQLVQAVEVLQLANQAAPGDPDILLRLGQALLAQEAPTRALAYLRQADTLAPSERTALPLAQAMLRLGHLTEARQVLEPLIGMLRARLQSEDPVEQDQARAMLPEAEWAFARVLLNQGEEAQALPLLESVVARRPTDPEAVLALARAWLRSGVPAGQLQPAARAVEVLEQALRMGVFQSRQGLRAEAQLWLAEAYRATGELLKAWETYQAVQETPLARQPAWRKRLALGLAQVGLQLDHLEEALQVLLEAAQAEPANLELQKALAEAYLANGLGAQALETARGVLTAEPQSAATQRWFVDLGLQLYEQEGDQTPYRSGLIQVLQKATELEPDRLDLLAGLGKLLLENDDREAAQEVFRRLINRETDEQMLPEAILRQAAEAMIELGDYPLGTALLQQLLRQLKNSKAPAEARRAVELGELHLRLSQVYEQSGEVQPALQALDQALEFLPERAELYVRKADLLQAIGRNDEVLSALQQALELQPRQGAWHQRLARLLRQKGEWAAALQHAHQAVNLLSEAQEVSDDLPGRLLAAELAYTLLRPRQAISYLNNLALPIDEQQQIQTLYLQAELALEVGDQSLATAAVTALQNVAAHEPRSLALQARLFARRGDTAAGLRLVQEALEIIEAAEPKSLFGEGRDFGREVYRAVGQAAGELGLWEPAERNCRRASQSWPSDPLSELKFVQVMVQQAEAQWLCQDLEVTRHGPTRLALNEDTWRIFSDTLDEAERQVAVAAPWEDILTEFRPDEPRVALRLWRARGLAAFQPTLEHVLAYEEELQALLPQAGEVAALMAGLRQARQTERVIAIGRGEWRPELAAAWANHPQVLTQLALALEYPDPQEAFKVAQAALKRLEEMAAIWPERPMLHFHLARLAYRLGILEQALEELKASLTAWPEEGRWLLLAAQIYLGLGVPDLDAALAALQGVECQGPECAPLYLKLGCGYLERGEARQAIPLLEQAARLDASQTETWMWLAQAYRRLGDLEKAAAHAEQAITKSAEAAPALLLRAEIALQANNPRGAFSRAQAALRLQPNLAAGWQLLARALSALNRPAEALVALEKALALSGNAPELQLERLQLIRRAKGLEQALPALEELATSRPKDAALLALATEWLAEAGKQEAAVQAARLALQEDQGELTADQRGRLHYLIGMAMRRAGQLDQAIHHLSQVIQATPECLEAILELGRVYQERREYRLALKTYQKAIQVAPEDHRAYYQAGLVLRDSKDYAAAEAMLRKAAQLAPNDVSVHRQLGAVVALSLVHNGGLKAP